MHIYPKFNQEALVLEMPRTILLCSVLDKLKKCKLTKTFKKENKNFMTVYIFSYSFISLQREEHMGQVHRVARELEDGMQRWQDRIMLMQYEQLRRAKENAALYTDNKRLRAEIDNRRRTLEHSAKIQK